MCESLSQYKILLFENNEYYFEFWVHKPAFCISHFLCYFYHHLVNICVITEMHVSSQYFYTFHFRTSSVENAHKKKNCVFWAKKSLNFLFIWAQYCNLSLYTKWMTNWCFRKCKCLDYKHNWKIFKQIEQFVIANNCDYEEWTFVMLPNWNFFESLGFIKYVSSNGLNDY